MKTHPYNNPSNGIQKEISNDIRAELHDLADHITRVEQRMAEEGLFNGYNIFLHFINTAKSLRTTIMMILRFDSETYHK